MEMEYEIKYLPWYLLVGTGACTVRQYFTYTVVMPKTLPTVFKWVIKKSLGKRLPDDFNDNLLKDFLLFHEEGHIFLEHLEDASVVEASKEMFSIKNIFSAHALHDSAWFEKEADKYAKLRIGGVSASDAVDYVKKERGEK